MRFFPFDVESLHQITGYSNKSGFKIRTGEQDFHTPNFDPNADQPNNLKMATISQLICLALLMLMPALVTNLGSHTFLGVIWSVTTALTIFISYTSLLPLVVLFKNREAREWHASEHKSIRLLASGREIGLENLHSCNAVSILCGSVLTTCVLEYFLAIWGVITFIYWPWGNFYLRITTLIISWVMLISLVFFIWLRNFDQHKKCGSLLYLLALPASILPYLGQRFMALKDPSEDKLVISLEVVKKIKSDPGFNDFFYRNRVRDTQNCE